MSALHYWDSPFQLSSHYLARCFADAGWRVAYLSAPITPLHLLKPRKSELAARYRSYFRGISPEKENGIFSYVPGALLAPGNHPLLRSEWLVENWASFSFPSLSSLLHKAGFGSPDVCYLDNFYHAGIRKIIDPKITCYHMVDDYSGFPGYGGDFEHVEKKLCLDTDIVIYPSSLLKDRVERFNSRDSLFLPNGVDFSRFEGVLPVPALLAKIPKPIAIYVGAMDEWFDHELVKYCAERLPGVSFVLLGPHGDLPKYFEDVSNVFFMGVVNRENLPAYLGHADVGLIPFRVERFRALIDPVRPLKLLEYLASGLPVVSVSWRELFLMRSPAILADDRDEFLQAIRYCLSTSVDRSALKSYAAKYSWKDIFKSLEKKILLKLR